MPRDIADRTNRGSTDLARAFCDIVRHSENMFGVLVQQQMIIAKTMGELAASIAHEVNQPLAGIVTNTNEAIEEVVMLTQSEVRRSKVSL